MMVTGALERNSIPAKVLFAVALCGALPAFGFNPPEGEAGPIKVRIDGPKETNALSTPLSVTVTNTSSEALTGTLRLGVVDDWRLTPEADTSFSLEAGASVSHEFILEAGAQTFQAHYPVHAWASAGKWTAHAVLVFEHRLPGPARPVAERSWKTVSVPENTAFALGRAPLSRTALHFYNNPDPLVLPVGWTGSEASSRAVVHFGRSIDRQGMLPAITVHPPWYGGLAGTALIEFPLALPPQDPLVLSFSTAIEDHQPNEPPSDGVTFRVRVAEMDAPDGAPGEILFERHSDAKAWETAEVDLAPFADKTIRLQFETDPGPNRDCTCDRACWGAPTLIAGTPPAETAPKPPKTPSRFFDIFSSREIVRIWPGDRGMLDAVIAFKGPEGVLSFRGIEVSVGGDALEDRGALHRLISVQEEPGERGPWRMRHIFLSPEGDTFDLVMEGWIQGEALRVSVALENAPEPRPWSAVHLEDIAIGPWSEAVHRVYAGQGNVIVQPQAFSIPYDGHQLATSFVGAEFTGRRALVLGLDVPPSRLEVNPETKRFSLHASHGAVLTFIPCNDVWEGVKILRDLDTRPAPGGVKQLAGRFVFDLWGGRYAESAVALEKAFLYGLTDAAVVWHNWQRWGYDYRLPEIYPPNPSLGTLEEFKALARLCKERGVLFAPHDNYIDLYPDAAAYTMRNIAFTADRQPIHGWYNAGRDAQSYRWRADAIRPYVEENLALIRENITPNAFFIDVFSSIRPHDYWTVDGEFRDLNHTNRIWGETFAWIREYLGNDAPQISESGHDALVGWLDGAQANHLRVDPDPPGKDAWFSLRVRCAAAERIPWIDAAHHHRFILHGAGYDPRYRCGLNRPSHGIYSDDYIATEVLTGRPGMVDTSFSRDVVRKYWLTQDLARALALDRIDSVTFVGNYIHYQRVVWESGAVIEVNRGEADQTVDKHHLPQYGFLARYPGGEAAIAWRDGHIVEWSRGSSGWYVNGRGPSRETPHIQVRSAHIQYPGENRLEVTLFWHAHLPLNEDATVFVHAMDEEESIRFQGDHRPPVPTTEWHGEVITTAQMKVPAGTPPGSRFEIRAGLYDPRTGRRYPLTGLDDGNFGQRLGTFVVPAEGEQTASVMWSSPEDGANPRVNLAAAPIDFGGVVTAGGCRIEKDGKGLRVIALPSSAAFDVRIDWAALPWDLPPPTRIEYLDSAGVVRRTSPALPENGVIVIAFQPEDFGCRLH